MSAGKTLGVLFALFVFAGLGCGPAGAADSQDSGVASRIRLPSGDDEYAKLVRRAALHDESVDFATLRLAYLTSAARKTEGDTDALRKALFEAVNANDDQRVLDAAIALVSADYIDMYGHKFLRQVCAKLHDDACAEQGRFVEFGLLRSITDKGDGTTCQTGWPVVTIKEEYFMLDMIGVRLKLQSLVNGPPSCDVMDTTDDQGHDATYNFRIEAVLKDEQSMFDGNH